MNRTLVTFLLLVSTSFALVDDSNAEICRGIADIVFVIDASRSIYEPDFTKQLEFVKQVVQTLDIGQGKTRIGALTFSHTIVKEFYLKAYDSVQDILSALSAIQFTAGDTTNTFDALSVLRTEYFSESNGDRSDVINIAIVLTDGESSDNTRTLYEAKLTKEAGIATFAVGIGTHINKMELEQIASSPTSDFMHILESFTQLESEAFTKILSHKVCNVFKNNSVVDTCGRIADLVFVIDSSSSIWESNFVHQLELVKKVVNAFDVGQDKTRIGALSFSNTIIREFHLKQFNSKQDIMNMIPDIQYIAGDSTKTDEALRVLRTEYFSQWNGDRPDVPNIAIIITDGAASDRESTLKEAILTREAGIAIYAIGIGDKVNKEELEEMASSPKSDYVHTLVNFEELQSDAFIQLFIDKVCKG